MILASKSPRRRDLLLMLGVKDLKLIPAAGEEPEWQGENPADFVCGVAMEKAREVAGRTGSKELIIAADTLVCLDGELLGKPRDPEQACAMLRRLSGNRHTVYTGLAALYEGNAQASAEATEVYFRTLEPAEIVRYVESGEPMDKAGAYGIQGFGSVFVKRIEGDYFNVVGLPLCRLYQMVAGLGCSLGAGR